MKFIFLILTKLSFKFSQRLGIFVGFIFNLGGKNKRITTQNIALCFADLSVKDRKKIVKNSLIELGKLIFESFFIWGNDFKTHQKIITSIKGLEIIQTNEPTIIMAPHLSGFEIIGGVLSLTRPITTLYKPAKNQIINTMIFNARNSDNQSLAPTTNRGIISLTKVLDNGGMVGILPDQYANTGGITANFLGVPTKTTTLLPKLAQKYNAIVVLAYTISNKNGYDLILKKVDIKAENITKSVEKMNKIIGDLVQKFPEKYIWNYKKFKGFYNYK